MSLFLTQDELAELTGIKRGKGDKTRNQLQVEQLRKMGVPFYINACGRPVVTRARLEGTQQQDQEKPQGGWRPTVLRSAA